MSAINRLPPPAGLLIDRTKPVPFTFEGRAFSGFHGDTIASALAASGQWILSRSFKYHRPRGVLSLCGHDANTLVQLPAEPNTLADLEPITPGLDVRGQNYFGSLEHDRASMLGWFSAFLPVGFYYKAFFRPRGAWAKWAPWFRKLTGLGVIDTSAKPQYFDKKYSFTDVAVIGAGAAGMQAAVAAAQTGADVLLIEESAVLGGWLNYGRVGASEEREQLLAAIAARPNITVMTGSSCNGWFSDNWLSVVSRNRLWKVRAKEVIACTGAIEQQVIFRNNDLPGVMLGSAVQRLIRLYGVRPGKRAVVLTGNNEGYAAALDLLDAGVDVAEIVDLRDQPKHDGVAREAIARGLKIFSGATVYEALPNGDGSHLAAVDIRAIVAPGKCANEGRRVDCDLLSMSGGFMPAFQLPCHAGASLAYRDEASAFAIQNLPAGFRLAGAVNGEWGDGASAGPNVPWPIFHHPRGMEFVDFDEDLRIADFANAVSDGFEHAQLVKRYSTSGMGPSQGRHSALASARLIAAATGRSVSETGVTTARPPASAEFLSHSAGRRFYPARRTGIHHAHLEAGAQMMQAGAWYRPAFYGPKDARDEAVEREVSAVRNRVGLIDISTLGGLEIRGADAAEFMNRLYTLDFASQAVGRARYALMTNETGTVIDDGVACRLDSDHFYVTATTSGVDAVFRSMLKWNAQWRLAVDVAGVTGAFCGVNIAGPLSRDVLRTVCDDIDLSPAAFPFMAVREGTVAGIPARLIRVGFVGELGYEIHAPQSCGEALWNALMAAGKPQDIQPFGVEAQRVLRLEKGHIIVGQDTDALATPSELGMGWAISRKKPFFVGRRTLEELGRAPPKRALVGFILDRAERHGPQEGHLLVAGDRIVGRVTSCEYSPTLRKRIGLAFVQPELAQPETEISIRLGDGALVAAKVVPVPFYDAKGARQEV